MAITNVNIVQDNITGGVDLLNVASPLVFLVDATYTIAPPDNLYAKIYDKDSVMKGTFRCMPWRDTSSTNRRFSFEASEILRQFLLPLDDRTQSGNTLELVSGMTMHFKIVFSNLKLETGVTDEIEFEAINAASQFGEYPANIPVGTNLPQGQIGAAGQWAYAYFYDNVGVGTITTEETAQDKVTEHFETISNVVVSNIAKTQISASVIRLSLSLGSISAISGTARIHIPITADISKYKIKINGFSGNFDVPLANLSRFLFGVKYGVSSQWLTEIIPAVGEFEHVIDLNGVTDFYITMTKQGTVSDIYVDIDFIEANVSSGILNPCSNG